MDDKFLYKLVKGQTFSIVAQDGTANELDPGLPEDLLLKMYRGMVQGRLYDDKALKLQAAGRMGTYPPISGQEAVQVGSTLALEKEDWLVPSYRELASMLVKGVSLKAMYLAWMGNDYGNVIPEGDAGEDCSVATTWKWIAIDFGDAAEENPTCT
jgi:pyruvate dehydrogenase E1 component alpha subunit